MNSVSCIIYIMSHRKVKRRIQWGRLFLLGILVFALTFGLLVLKNRHTDEPEPTDTTEPVIDEPETPEPTNEPVQSSLLTLAPADAAMPAGDNNTDFYTSWYI